MNIRSSPFGSDHANYQDRRRDVEMNTPISKITSPRGPRFEQDD